MLGGVGAAADFGRFQFAYLTGFVFAITVALGALFFVLIQHLTKAGWSVGPRRHAEWLAPAALGARSRRSGYRR